MLQEYRPRALLPGGKRRQARFAQMIQRDAVRSLATRYGYQRANPLAPPVAPR